MIIKWFRKRQKAKLTKKLRADFLPIVQEFLVEHNAVDLFIESTKAVGKSLSSHIDTYTMVHEGRLVGKFSMFDISRFNTGGLYRVGWNSYGTLGTKGKGVEEHADNSSYINIDNTIQLNQLESDWLIFLGKKKEQHEL